VFLFWKPEWFFIVFSCIDTIHQRDIQMYIQMLKNAFSFRELGFWHHHQGSEAVIYIIIESWVSVWWLSPPKQRDVRWRNLACRCVPFMCRTTGGYHVDRGHRWEENVTFNLQLYIKLQERHIMPSRWWRPVMITSSMQHVCSCGATDFHIFQSTTRIQSPDGAHSAIYIHGMEHAAR